MFFEDVLLSRCMCCAPQIQATAVLPTCKVTLLVLLVDLPSVVLNALNENRDLLSAVLISSVAIVFSRLLLDAQLRGLLIFKSAGQTSTARDRGNATLHDGESGHSSSGVAVSDRKKKQ